MDQLPDRLRVAAGDEPVIESVDLGGGDGLVVTPGATYLYRAEGLLSDESVETYSHDVQRFAVQESRRKHTIVLEGIDGEQRFTVPATAVDSVAEAVLEGILRTVGVVDAGETVTAQFRFSDLTLVVTDAKLFKHVGPSVWNEDYEMFDYGSLTDLDFEEGSVATQVVVEVQGRQHRIKVPNERAGRVRREVQSAVFEFHGVSSLGGLRNAVGLEEPDEEPQSAASVAEPRVGDRDADRDEDAFSGTEWSPPADQDVTGPRGRTDRGSDDVDEGSVASDAAGSAGSAGEDAPTAAPDTEERRTASRTDPDEPVDVQALAERVEALEAQLERQQELLESQTEAFEQLVEELRRGR